MESGKVIFNTVILFAFMLVAGLAVNPGSAQAAMSKAKQHKLYKSTMAKYDKTAREVGRKFDKGKENTYYAFVDIDKNGIDECILRYGGSPNTAVSSGFGENTSIYTIKNNKVKAVLENHKMFNPSEHDDYVRVHKNRSMIDLGFSHGEGDYFFYMYKNGKIKKKGSIRICIYTNQEGKKVANINDKLVSASVGKKKYNQLSNKGKGYKMKKYKG